MAVVLRTWGEQLGEVQTAISAVLVNQKYELNGRRLERADLEWLHKREEYLTDKLASNGDVVAGSTVSRGAYQVSFS